MSDEIIKSIATNTIALGILSFLFKSIIGHWLDKDISSFKSKVESNAKEAIASYQSTLEKERIRLQIQYGGIFEKQAEAILKLYKLIVAFEKSINDAMFNKDEGKSYKQFISHLRALTKFYDDHQVLFPEVIEKLFIEFQKTAFFATGNYRSTEKRLSRNNITPQQYDNIFAQQDKALAELEQIPNLKKELTLCLRKTIGTIESNS